MFSCDITIYVEKENRIWKVYIVVKVERSEAGVTGPGEAAR